MPELSFFSLLGTRLATTSSGTSQVEPLVAGSHGEWTTFSSEIQSFLSALYSQPDSSPHFTEPGTIHQRSKHQERASAETYASLVNLVEELGDEYLRRFDSASGAKMHLAIQNGALVLYWSSNGEAMANRSAADAVKGFILLKPAEASEFFGDVSRHLSDDGGFALVTNLERSYLCRLTRADSLLVADITQAWTLFEALFFLIHCVFQGSAGAPAGSNHKRKLEMISDNPTDPYNRGHLMKTCRLLGFSFGVIADLVSLDLRDVQVTGELISDTGEYSVHRASFRGEKALVKTYKVDGFQYMVREVWVLRKLESLGVDVVPRLHAFGLVRGHGCYVIMEDVSSGGDENVDLEKKKRYVDAARSSLRILHTANVVHNRISMESFVVGKGGRVFWINLESAGVYERDDDAEEFLTLSSEDYSQLP